MARIDTLANFLEDVATKIRSKTGSQSTITPANYDTEIDKIVYQHHGLLCFNLKSIGATSVRTDDTTTTLNLKNLDTSLMTNFNYMFYGFTVLTSLDLSNFNTSNVTNMQNMFNGCWALTSLNLSSFDTSKVKNMIKIFAGCSSLTALNLSTFDTSSVTSMNQMFYACRALTTINFGNNFNFNSVTNLQNMFQNCTKLDNNTLNAILYLCTTVGQDYTGTKTLAQLGIDNTFDNFDNIPNLSNYQDFLDAGWTIS